MISTLIFDFDGTIADSLDTATEVINTIGSTYGFPKVTSSLIRAKGIKGLVQEFKVPLFKLPLYVIHVRRAMKTKMKFIRPIRGIQKVLSKLSKTYAIGLLTSNSEENARLFLKKHDLEQYVNFIYTGSSLFGKDKLLKKIFRSKHVSPNECLCIGDETRDIESAKKTGVKCIAVSWGLESEGVLKHASPSYIASTPSELLDIILSIQ